MADDLSVVHPDLREIWKKFPRFSFNRWNARVAQRITRWMRTPPVPTDVRLEQYSVRSQDDEQDIRLRVYRPVRAPSPVPVLVWIHGGGYIIGLPEQDDAYAFELVTELGLIVVSIDYRLAPRYPFPTPLDDCYSGLCWVSANAERLGIDPGRIAVGGMSAGGGLAAAVAQLAHDRGEIPLAFQLLVAPMLDDRTQLRADFPHPRFLTWTPQSNRYGWEAYLGRKQPGEPIPAYAAAARRTDLHGLPPAWIGVGTLDLFESEDTAYARDLIASGVECELVIVPGAFHGFDALNFGAGVIRDFHRSQKAALRKYLLLD